MNGFAHYLTQSLHRAVRQTPERLATIDGPRRKSWQEIGLDVSRLAGVFKALGLKPGDRVGLLAQNHDTFLIYFFATWWAGGVINPVNIRWTPAEMAFSLTDCETRILIVDGKHADLVPQLRRLAPCLEHILALDWAGDGVADYQGAISSTPPAIEHLRSGDDLAAVLYTGGTTGRPKGVMLSHRALTASSLGYVGRAGCSIGPVILHTAPLFHVGAISGMISGWLSGSTHAFVPAFEPEAVLQTLQEAHVSDVFLVPTMIQAILDHPNLNKFDLRALRKILYGAAPITPALMDRITQRFPQCGFAQAYGMTELAPVVTLLSPDDHRSGTGEKSRLRSVGRPTAVVEVRIADADDGEVPPGTPGEIQVRGETVMTGYWNRPEETAAALRGGWMHTGDVGAMDNDGYISIVDRLKDMIITGGENVFSVEVEGALASHPEVSQCAVIGRSDQRWGERVHAVVVRVEGSEVGGEALSEHCRSLIAGFKIPRSYEFVDSLPLSAAGKVLKQGLRDGPTVAGSTPKFEPDRK